MEDVEEPTWRLVLKAVETLRTTTTEFQLAEIVSEVRRLDPARGRSSVQPVIQGMTSNAGTGPRSPCGTPLVRVSHGVYRMVDSPPAVATSSRAASRAVRTRVASLPRAERDAEVTRRVHDVVVNFDSYAAVYDSEVPFKRAGQYESHRATVELRKRHPNTGGALQDDAVLDSLYQTLQKWGIGRRGSKLVSQSEFRSRLRDQTDAFAVFDALQLEDPGFDVNETAGALWSLISSLDVVDNFSLIVPGTKTLHHLLPELVPPMDRAWTGAFFIWSPVAAQSQQRQTFMRTFASFAEIARAVHPSRYVGAGWRTTSTKVLDNAVIGYCKTHGISPASP